MTNSCFVILEFIRKPSRLTSSACVTCDENVTVRLILFIDPNKMNSSANFRMWVSIRDICWNVFVISEMYFFLVANVNNIFVTWFSLYYLVTDERHLVNWRGGSWTYVTRLSVCDITRFDLRIWMTDAGVLGHKDIYKEGKIWVPLRNRTFRSILIVKKHVS